MFWELDFPQGDDIQEASVTPFLLSLCISFEEVRPSNFFLPLFQGVESLESVVTWQLVGLLPALIWKICLLCCCYPILFHFLFP